MNLTTFALLIFATGLILHGVSCTPPANPDELDELGVVDMTIKGKVFRLWVADDAIEQARGLMEVSSERMAPLPDGTERGMIFVFDHVQERSFWMRNTIIPLDIAYIASDGRVVKTYTMAPLDDRHNQYPSIEPIRYAIEVNAGVFREIGLSEGDTITLPSAVLKRKP